MEHSDNGDWQEVNHNRKRPEEQRGERREENIFREPNPWRRQERRDHLPITVEYVYPTEQTLTFQQFMLLLCGIPGSGKSTFARALERAMPYKYVRINQDELGTRKACEAKARQVLKEGKCPVIDRCNFDERQRSNWLQLVKEHSSTTRDDIPVDCVVLHLPIQECIRRCESRSSHETIIPEEAAGIVRRMARQFSLPPPARGEVKHLKRSNAQECPSSYRSVSVIPNGHLVYDKVLEYLNKL